MTKRAAQQLAADLQAKGILRVRRFNSGGPGGQHQNTTENGVELIGTWRARDKSELVVKATATLRSQHDSMRLAVMLLIARFSAAVTAARQARKERSTATFGSGRYVRSYHEPDNRVVDHASGSTRSWSETVGKNRLGPLIDARRDAALEVLA